MRTAAEANAANTANATSSKPKANADTTTTTSNDDCANVVDVSDESAPNDGIYSQESDNAGGDREM